MSGITSVILILPFLVITSLCRTTNAESPYLVYENTKDPIAYYYGPGAGEITSDDMTLAVTGGCQMDSYSLLVYSPGGGDYNVYVDLWSDDPCAETPSPIEGTAVSFLNLAPDEETPRLLTATLDPPIQLPSMVYMRVVFSTNQAGWIIANQAEIGSTLDQFWRDEPQFDRCAYYWWCCDGDPYAGFWASITCGILGDFNADHQVDLSDVPGFSSALVGLDPDGAGRADLNEDRAADGLDIAAFVETVVGV